MKNWNYRVVENHDGVCGIHEVYYADDGVTVEAWTARAVGVVADDRASLPEELLKVRDALAKPVLQLKELERARAVARQRQSG